MSAGEQFAVIVADDHLAVAQALTLLLSRHFATLSPVHSIPQLRASLGEWTASLRPPPGPRLVVLLDPEYPYGEDGLDALSGLRQEFPSVRFVIYSDRAKPIIVRAALLEGADGFVAKACGLTELQLAIRAAFKDHPKVFLGSDVEPDVGVGDFSPDRPLPPALRRVLLCLQAGKRRREIADVLGVSLSAVEADITRLRRAFGAPGRKSINWKRCRER